MNLETRIGKLERAGGNGHNAGPCTCGRVLGRAGPRVLGDGFPEDAVRACERCSGDRPVLRVVYGTVDENSKGVNDAD